MHIFFIQIKTADGAVEMQQFIKDINIGKLSVLAPTLLACALETDYITAEQDLSTLLDSYMIDTGMQFSYFQMSFTASSAITHALLSPETWENSTLSEQASTPEQLLLPICHTHAFARQFNDFLSSSAQETLHHLFIHNLNVLQTAKSLYIHRNTLNYRLEHIYESTGINPQSFYGAMCFHAILNHLNASQ